MIGVDSVEAYERRYVTQVEEVLNVLNDAPRGLTQNDLHARTQVPKNVLATYLWDLKKEGVIQRVGGVRGSFRYGLTDQGRERIGAGGDPLKILARAVAGGNAQARAAIGDFDETLKVLDRLDEYRTLRRFAEWLAAERESLFMVPESSAPMLHRAVLEFLGIDATTYQRQSAALIGLLEFMKETT